MLSKAKIKLVSSLKMKKYRDEESLFFVEGVKISEELLRSEVRVRFVVALPEWLEANRGLLRGVECIEVREEELARISALKHPQRVLVVAEKPAAPGPDQLSLSYHASAPALLLDGLQDPGNLGTILRLCDWFGIPTIFASPDTADLYNPKVIQASMGSFLRVQMIYTSLPDLLQTAGNQALYGTFMDGQSIYETQFEKNAWIVMGNEGNGISDELSRLIKHRITIPAQPSSGAESLNVSIATAITLSEFRRKA